MTVEEVSVMNKMCTAEGMEVNDAVEFISCVDDLLSIQKMEILFNAKIGKRKHTARRMKDIMEARIASANFSTNTDVE